MYGACSVKKIGVEGTLVRASATLGAGQRLSLYL